MIPHKYLETLQIPREKILFSIKQSHASTMIFLNTNVEKTRNRCCESDGDKDSCTDTWLGLLKAPTLGNTPKTPTWKTALYPHIHIDRYAQRENYLLAVSLVSTER